ncbi:MAG: hypothetical protein J6C33_02595 [Lachnospiraceae bacterium]|nr:hypothetical protein [Lachnospiraceae bacterium]
MTLYRANAASEMERSGIELRQARQREEPRQAAGAAARRDMADAREK